MGWMCNEGKKSQSPVGGETAIPLTKDEGFMARHWQNENHGLRRQHSEPNMLAGHLERSGWPGCRWGGGGVSSQLVLEVVLWHDRARYDKRPGREKCPGPPECAVWGVPLGEVHQGTSAASEEVRTQKEPGPQSKTTQSHSLP